MRSRVIINIFYQNLRFGRNHPLGSIENYKNILLELKTWSFNITDSSNPGKHKYSFLCFSLQSLSFSAGEILLKFFLAQITAFFESPSQVYIKLRCIKLYEALIKSNKRASFSSTSEHYPTRWYAWNTSIAVVYTRLNTSVFQPALSFSLLYRHRLTLYAYH